MWMAQSRQVIAGRAHQASSVLQTHRQLLKKCRPAPRDTTAMLVKLNLLPVLKASTVLRELPCRSPANVATMVALPGFTFQHVQVHAKLASTVPSRPVLQFMPLVIALIVIMISIFTRTHTPVSEAQSTLLHLRRFAQQELTVQQVPFLQHYALSEPTIL